MFKKVESKLSLKWFPDSPNDSWVLQLSKYVWHVVGESRSFGRKIYSCKKNTSKQPFLGEKNQHHLILGGLWGQKFTWRSFAILVMFSPGQVWYWNSLGQSATLHFWISVELPRQTSSPPYFASPQARSLTWVPLPQVTEHWDHWPHGRHPASFATKKE